MSVLDHPRVVRFGADGFEVTTKDGKFQVLPNDAMGWGIYHRPHLDMLVTDQGPAIGFVPAESAIGALLS